MKPWAWPPGIALVPIADGTPMRLGAQLGKPVLAIGPVIRQQDRILHKARVHRSRRQLRFNAEASDIPAGAFILWQGTPHLVTQHGIVPWVEGAYGPAQERPDASVLILTPKPTVALLAHGFNPVSSQL